MAKKKTPSVVTPRAAAVWPKLVQPDEFKGEKSYKVGLLLDPQDEAHAKFIQHVEEAGQAAYDEWKQEAEEEATNAKGAAKAKAKKALEAVAMFTPLSPEYDDEGEETGRLILNVKMKAEGVNPKTSKTWKRRCPIFDSAGKELTGQSGLSIWGGSILKAEVTLNPFAMPATEKAGVSGRLEAIQIVELATGNAGGKFGVEEDGYVAEETTNRFDDDEDDDNGEDDDEEDF